MSTSGSSISGVPLRIVHEEVFVLGKPDLSSGDQILKLIQFLNDTTVVRSMFFCLAEARNSCCY